MIPNLVKGKGITGGIRYAFGEGNDDLTGERKTLKAGQVSRAEILGGQNFGFEVDSAERLELARRMMEWNGKEENQASRTRKCENDCLHASLSWEKGQEPTAADMVDAGRGLLKSLGMETAQAVFIAHNDTEHRHMHIIASRLDPLTGKTFSQTDDFTKAQAWSLQYERDHDQVSKNEARKNLHAIVDAIDKRNGAAIVDNLTQRSPTFTARELDKALSLGAMTPEAKAGFRSEILADKNVIELRDSADSQAARYTTRDVLASEMQLLASADALKSTERYGLDAAKVTGTAKAHTLNPEQAGALAHLTQNNGLALLWGEAGTGKSHTLKAVKSAYEESGAKVWGLAWTNDVAQQMAGDGFKNTSTIAAAMKGIEHGQIPWAKNTVLIVDEAAMIATKHLAALAGAAEKAGAKLILAGDDKQLGSIERGGMFETLRQQHGAAVLSDVQRVNDVDQKSAFNQMHEGKFRAALATFDKKGGIHWSDKQTEAVQDMAAKYAADTKAAPDKRRFMFAHTNAEVQALNQQARELHKKRGDLGQDHRLPTAHGEAIFATGDRIQFAGNGYGKTQKAAGLTNGRVGTITALDFEGDFLTPRVTVALDVAKGAKPQSISFVVGDNGKAGEFDNFKHGYAGTIYKGQGKTLDQSYVCHSPQWRSSSAYVALTRHRESVAIFASRQTIKTMDQRPELFKIGAVATTKDPPRALNAHALDVMARGLERRDTKRAASAYEISERSALLMNFDDLTRAVAKGRPQSPQERALAALLAVQREAREQSNTPTGDRRDGVAKRKGGTTHTKTRKEREDEAADDIIRGMLQSRARSGRGRSGRGGKR